MEKRWITTNYPSYECPNCGKDLEVLMDEYEKDWDCVRCECGFKGELLQDQDTGQMRVSNGNIDQIMKEETQRETWDLAMAFCFDSLMRLSLKFFENDLQAEAESLSSCAVLMKSLIGNYDLLSNLNKDDENQNTKKDAGVSGEANPGSEINLCEQPAAKTD